MCVFFVFVGFAHLLGLDPSLLSGVSLLLAIPYSPLRLYSPLFSHLLPIVDMVLTFFITQFRKAEMELKKGQNLIEHADEIYSRPARTWFQTGKQKEDAEGAFPPILLRCLGCY